MNKKEKQELVYLLNKFKQDIIKHWPEGNNLPCEFTLCQLSESIDDIVFELNAQLKKNYSFKDLK